VGLCAVPQAYVVFGASSFPPRLNVDGLNNKTGFKIIGGQTFFGGFTSSAGAGDINGDGKPDFIVGNYDTADDVNVVFVVYGAREFPFVLDVSRLNGANGFKVIGSSGLGLSVDGIGDFNSDGKDDLVLGTGVTSQAYVIFGADHFPSVMYTSSLNGSNGFTIFGPSWFGLDVAGVGDINQDHIPDLGISAVEDAFFIFGAKHFNATFDLSSLNGTNGMQFVGPSGSSSMNSGLEFKGSKLGVIVGAPYANEVTGAAFVFFKADHFPPVLQSSDLDGTNGFEIVDSLPHGWFGAAVAGIENFTPTGESAIVVGAPYGRGATYIIFDV
jgi:hypothetical protein